MLRSHRRAPAVPGAVQRQRDGHQLQVLPLPGLHEPALQELCSYNNSHSRAPWKGLSKGPRLIFKVVLMSHPTFYLLFLYIIDFLPASCKLLCWSEGWRQFYVNWSYIKQVMVFLFPYSQCDILSLPPLSTLPGCIFLMHLTSGTLLRVLPPPSHYQKFLMEQSQKLLLHRHCSVATCST